LSGFYFTFACRFTACVTDTGLIYTWGSNSNFQLGLDAHTTPLNQTLYRDIVPIPQCVEVLKRQPVVQIACGWEHVISLSQDGAVHSWGSNAFDQLGLRYNQSKDYNQWVASPDIEYEIKQDPSVLAAQFRRQISRPVKNLFLSYKNVKQVACGAFHSLALTVQHTPRDATELHSWGKGWHGQLGLGDFQSLDSKFMTSPYPVSIPFFQSDIIVLSKVYGSEFNSAALDTLGNVYVWGSNEASQACRNSSETYIVEPVLVPFFIRKGIIDLAIGSDHGLALDSTGVVFAWGSNSHGQLGLGRHVGQLSTPEKIVRALYLSERVGDRPRVVKDVIRGQDQICPKIVKIAAGVQFSAMLSSEPEDPEVEKPLPFEKDYQIPAVQNRCYTFGSGKGSKAGLPDKSNVYLPTRVDFRSDGEIFEDVQDIAIGVNHLVAITFPDLQFDIESQRRRELYTKIENAKPRVAADDFGVGGASNQFLETKESELSKWLDKFGLPMYKDDLIKNNIWLKPLMDMTEDALRDAFPSIGARRRLVIAITKQRLGDTLISILENERPEMMDESITDATISTHKKVVSLMVHRLSVAQLEALWTSPPALAAKIHEIISILQFEEPLLSAIERFIDEDIKRRKAMKEREARKDQNFKRDLDFLQHGLTSKPPLKSKISSIILHRSSLELLMMLFDDTASGKERLAAACEKGELTLNQRIQSSILLLTSEAGTPEATECGSLVNLDWIQPSVLFTVSQNSKFYFVQWQEPASSVDVVSSSKKAEEEPSRKELVFRALSARCLKSFFRTSLVKESKEKPKEPIRKIVESTICSFGVSSLGELGQGFKNSHATPQPIKHFQNSQIVQISCGDVHSLALSADGSVFSWGSNSYGQLGLTADLEQRTKCAYSPERIFSLALFHVKGIASGRNHNIVLTKQGPVLAWGQGIYGALGMDDSTDCDVGLPATIRLLSDSGLAVQAVECGGWHSCAFLDTGELYTWGYNGCGQLGLPSSVIKTSRPTLVQSRYFPEGFSGIRIKHVACGWEHTLALGVDSNDKQSVFSFGSNSHGQLGREPLVIGRGQKRDPDIAEIDFNRKRKLGTDRIEHLAAGRMHSLALSSSGVVWSWGDCSVGQLGRSIVISSSDMGKDAVDARTHPDIVTTVDFPKIAFIACGSMHNVVISVNGDMFAWGEGAEGQLGQSCRQMQYFPVRSETSMSFFAVSCGSRFSIALSSPRIHATQLLNWKSKAQATPSHSLKPVVDAAKFVNSALKLVKKTRHQVHGYSFFLSCLFDFLSIRLYSQLVMDWMVSSVAKALCDASPHT
jgi:alpha-tubulin suppressor-like RCC1 family protein